LPILSSGSSLRRPCSADSARSSLQQPVVEPQVQPVVGVGVAGAHRALHLIEQILGLAQLLGRDLLGQPAAHQFVHCGPQVVDFERLVERDVAHEDPAVLLLADQAGFLEHAKGLADRPARDAQALRQPLLGELGAGRQFAVEDHALDFLLGRARQRGALQQGDGGRRHGRHRRHGVVAPAARGSRHRGHRPGGRGVGKGACHEGQSRQIVDNLQKTI